jgi:methionyl-tRNA formyltransferase
MQAGAATETPQDDALATYAPKTEREHARLDWSRPADDLARAIRAYDPRPGAWTTLRGGEVKLFGAAPVVTEERPDTTPGEVIAVGPEGIVVKCGEDALRVGFAQPAGRPRLATDAWARGRGVELGDGFV